MRFLAGSAAMEGRPRSVRILSAWFFDYSREYVAVGSTALAAGNSVGNAGPEDGGSQLIAGGLQTR
jgi:hypothetical protein